MLRVGSSADNKALTPRTHSVNPSPHRPRRAGGLGQAQQGWEGAQVPVVPQCLSPRRDAPFGWFPETRSLLFVISGALFSTITPSANCSTLPISHLPAACMPTAAQPPYSHARILRTLALLQINIAQKTVAGCL